jgi:hypothetical protein
MTDIKKLIQKLNDPDLWPDDDKTTEDHKIAYLNRIDQEWGCAAILYYPADPYGQHTYCGMPEHDPFTNRCRDHTPGNLTAGHM